MNSSFKVNYLYLITLHTYKYKAFEKTLHDNQSTNIFSERLFLLHDSLLLEILARETWLFSNFYFKQDSGDLTANFSKPALELSRISLA